MGEPNHDRAASDAVSSAELASAVRRERERLAEALHDDALQRVMLAQQDLIEAEEEGDEDLRADVRRQLGELAHSLRATTRAMHDRSLEELPLSRALDRLAADGARRGRLAVTTVVAPEATGVHDGLIVRLTRELLANVVRHAQAENVDISLAREDETVVLRVCDDGRGIAAGELERAAASGHIGHARMRRTLASIGGTIEIVSAPGAGTTVQCALPVAALRAHHRLEASIEKGQGLGRLLAASDPRAESAALAVARVTNGAIAALPETALRIRHHPGRSLDERSEAAGRPGAEAAAETTDAAAVALARITALYDRPDGEGREADLDRLLEEIASAVGDALGWTVVLCVARPGEDALVARASHGLDANSWAAVRGTAYTRAQWDPLLDERFARGGAYLIPDGALRTAGPPEPSAGRGAWHDGDDLLVPFRGRDGQMLGVFSFGAPVSGRRPSDEELAVLATVAGHTGRLVRLAHESLARTRHASALAGLLEATARLTATPDPEEIPRRVADAVADHLGFGRVIVEVMGADGLMRPAAERGGETAGLEPLSGRELDALDADLLVPPGRAGLLLPAARRVLQRPGAGTARPPAWDGHLLMVPLRAHDGHVVGLVWLDAPADGLLPPARTVGALRSFTDQAAAALIGARTRSRLVLRSGRDELTRLPNRHAFSEELGREIARAGRTGLASMLVLAVVEGCPALDASRPLSEAPLGPDEQEIFNSFRTELRRDDRAFRIDGGLFALLLVGTERPPVTSAVTLRIAARLKAIGRGSGMTVNFGTAAIGPQGGSAAEVLGRARQQLLDRCRAVA